MNRQSPADARTGSAARTPLTSASGNPRHNRRRRRAGAALAVAMLLTSACSGATSAATSTSSGTAVATSYGFRCDATYNWVHQNWPNISVGSVTNQQVTVRALLWRWQDRWVQVATSATYVGVSNVHGRQILGQTAGGQPYYFAVAGQPSVVPPSDGYAFLSLADGYYATTEEYQAGGSTWPANNTVQGATDSWCAV